jgi:hypothetical protein
LQFGCLPILLILPNLNNNIVTTSALVPAGSCNVSRLTPQEAQSLLNITHDGFDAKKIDETQKKLDKMSPSQIGILVQVYKEKLEERKQINEAQREERKQMMPLYEQAVQNEEKLNLERAKAYRNHLQREYQYSITVKQQEIELMRRATEYQNWMLQNNWNRYNSGGNYYNHHRRW